MKTDSPIFQYTDYRAWLRDYYEQRKRTNARWSYRLWSRKLGVRSSSLLVMILKGKRHPGDELARELAREMGLDERETAFFQDLVRLAKAAGDEATVWLEKLTRDRTTPVSTVLGRAKFAAIANWHYYAIRELILLPDFREDAEWIAAQLNDRVRPSAVRDAIRTLLKLELIGRDAQGRLVQRNGNIDTPTDIADEGIKRFHEAILDVAKDTIRSESPDDRCLAGTTFAMRRQDLPRAKELLRKFQNDLTDLLEKTGGEADSVYHLELALLPLTRREGRQ